MEATTAQLLFSGGDLRASLDHQRTKLKEEIWQAKESYLLNTDIEEWVAYLVGEHRADIPVLDREGKYVEDLGEQQIDVRYDGRMRALSDYARPALMPGRRVVLHVPYSGDPMILKLQPSTRSLSPPAAIVRAGEIEIPFEYPSDVERPDIVAQSDRILNAIEQWLGWTRNDVAPYNDGLAARRERVMADHAHLDGLGIPVRKRSDAPQTYAAPGIMRKPSPTRPKAKATKPQAMEPTLVPELYEHALSVTRSMAKAMERTPASFAELPEERLRDHLLVMLNSHYEGQGQAEAFNKGGKTDILLRVQDRNVFIAECKIWSGIKSFGDALDQLFRYTTWRDTKLALVIFVRQKSLTRIIDQARAALAEHEDFSGWQDAEEGELRCRMRWQGDDDRLADLAVLFVHLRTD